MKKFRIGMVAFAAMAGMTLVAIICISCCSILRRQAIEGAWCDPQVSLSSIKYEWDSQKSNILIQCAYQLSQTARLRHPRTVWNNTDWERDISERANVISTGSLAAIIASDKPNSLRPLPFTTMADQIISMPSTASWILSFPESISLVSAERTKTVYRAPARTTISMLGMSDIETDVIFCSTHGWKTECVRLNVESQASEVQYTFDASGVHGIRISPDDIVYLDSNPKYTVFITETGTRLGTGILAIGIDTENNTPISILHPQDIDIDAQGYEWILSPDKDSLGLRIQHKDNKQESLWISKTGKLPEFHSVDENQWNEIMVQVKQELPSAITEGIRKHIEKELPEQPSQNNYYPPLTQ
ncbi:MAG: hypothetical protein JXR40_13940 [Pontiellaceae bacterium]|nr:hypothetical protein [Pontiellaceae bacterium]